MKQCAACQNETACSTYGRVTVCDIIYSATRHNKTECMTYDHETMCIGHKQIKAGGTPRPAMICARALHARIDHWEPDRLQAPHTFASSASPQCVQPDQSTPQIGGYVLGFVRPNQSADKVRVCVEGGDQGL